MHIFFSGIGGSGISSLAQICLDLGWQVSGSDRELNTTTQYLSQIGAKIYLQSQELNLASIHSQNNIDWYVHSPAITKNHPEYAQAEHLQIKTSKQNLLINHILSTYNLDLVAVCGTHGKTTTTAMLVWLCHKLNIQASWFIGSNPGFTTAGKYQKGSSLFIMEADEYDKKFLELEPNYSLVTNMDYDHPDTYPTINDYELAFSSFLKQTSGCSWLYQDTSSKLKIISGSHQLADSTKLNTLTKDDPRIKQISLNGIHNRENAWLAISAMLKIIEQKYPDLLSSNILNTLIHHISNFSGTSRRLEEIQTNLFSDYAHHPVEIKATIQAARDVQKSKNNKGKLVIVYQPHQNLRQHEIKQQYKNAFKEADLVYWLPTYLSRENPDLAVISPQELSSYADSDNIQVVDLNPTLKNILNNHLQSGDLIVGMGAGSIDDWLRKLK